MTQFDEYAAGRKACLNGEVFSSKMSKAWQQGWLEAWEEIFYADCDGDMV